MWKPLNHISKAQTYDYFALKAMVAHIFKEHWGFFSFFKQEKHLNLCLKYDEVLKSTFKIFWKSLYFFNIMSNILVLYTVLQSS